MSGGTGGCHAPGATCSSTASPRDEGVGTTRASREDVATANDACLDRLRRAGCFSGEPLGEDELSTKRGATFARFAGNRDKFQTSMGDACCRAPGCCLLGGCPLSFLCTQVHMRYKVLNHVAPGSGWDHYVCCQGYTGSCCCFHPGACCEKEMPRTCMFVEACCCAGLAVSSTRFVLMDQYKLVPDECDNRLIRFNNCMQVLSCICHFAAIFDRNLRDLAQIIDLIADIVFFSTAGCMTAQTNFEVVYRESLGSAGALPGAPPVAVASPIAAEPYQVGAPAEPETMDR